MKIIRTIVLYGLLALGASGKPISGCKRTIPHDVEVGGKSAKSLESRANPPDRRTYVDIGEAKREMSGETLFTDGLDSCIAIVVRSEEAMPEKRWDKILAHVASTMCAGEENPLLDTQLQNLFDLDDMTDIPNRQVFVLLNRDDSNPIQDLFNKYVLEKANDHWKGKEVVMYRDPTYVNEKSGARLWINGEREVYWSMFDDPYINA